jgi:hypothetical protein
MFKYFAVLIALYFGLVLPASAQLSLPTNYNYNCKSTAKFYKNLVFCLAPNGQQASAVGVVYRTAAPVSSSTGGAVVTSFSLPARTLVTTPNALRVRIQGTTAANANTKNVVFNFGSQAITILNTTANNLDFYADIEIYRTGASTQRVNVAGYANNALLTGLSVNATQTETSAIAISVSLGAATANADTVLQNFSIYGESD